MGKSEGNLAKIGVSTRLKHNRDLRAIDLQMQAR